MRITYTTQFKPCARVTYMHEYYAKGLCKTLKVRPTLATKRLMKNSHLVFKELPTCFVILYDCAHTEAFTELDIRLSFILEYTDPYFSNYTGLPFQEINQSQIYSLSNIMGNQNEEGKKLLTSDDTVSIADQVTQTPSVFSYQLDEKVSNAFVQVKDATGFVVEEYQTGEHLVSSVPINLSQEPSGKYTLELDGKSIFEFYTIEENTRNLFGMVDLHLKSPSVELEDYIFNIQTRQTLWKYLLINRDNAIYSNFEIVGLKRRSKVKFLQLEEEKELITGHKATVLLADQPLPLQERPENVFQLKMRKHATQAGPGVSLSLNLPAPSVTSLKPDLTDRKSGKIYSEMYVYL